MDGIEYDQIIADYIIWLNGLWLQPWYLDSKSIYPYVNG